MDQFLSDRGGRIRTPFAVLAYLSGAALPLIERALGVIEIRNRVVHEGYHPRTKVVDGLYDLLRVIGLLIRGPGLKFPDVGANVRVHAAKWREIDVKRRERLEELGLSP